mmetsp:Transcript_7046/g.10089  ORF Transcript_7046/g.10089 Transcript_7046/m.10089 type:complete len:120 (+) Transcript_7046:226-585(+)
MYKERDIKNPNRGIEVGKYFGGSKFFSALANFLAQNISSGEIFAICSLELIPCDWRVDMTALLKGTPLVRRHSNKEEEKRNAEMSLITCGIEYIRGTRIAFTTAKSLEVEDFAVFVMSI